MSRRVRRLDVPCIVPGCKEIAHYEFSSLRNLQNSYEQKHRLSYKCCRHSHGDNVLTPENLKTEWTSLPIKEENYGKFFGGSGVIIGQGYYVAATDFPAGTRVKLTCEILLPESKPIRNI